MKKSVRLNGLLDTEVIKESKESGFKDSNPRYSEDVYNVGYYGEMKLQNYKAFYLDDIPGSIFELLGFVNGKLGGIDFYELSVERDKYGMMLIRVSVESPVDHEVILGYFDRDDGSYLNNLGRRILEYFSKVSKSDVTLVSVTSDKPLSNGNTDGSGLLGCAMKYLAGRDYKSKSEIAICVFLNTKERVYEMRECAAISYSRRFLNFLRGIGNVKVEDEGSSKTYTNYPSFDNIEFGFVDREKLAYDFESFLCIKDVSDYTLSDLETYSDVLKGVKSPVTLEIKPGDRVAIPTGLTYKVDKKVKKLKLVATPGEPYMGKIDVYQALRNKNGYVDPIDLVLYVKNITNKSIVICVGTELARIEVVK